VQGYNAQTAVNEQQIVLAAEITNLSTDFSQLSPMVAAVLGELGRAGIDQKLLEAIAADAGYWNEQQMDDVVANQHIPVLVAPDKGSRDTPKRWVNEPRATWMRTVLKSDNGRERYANRKQTVEPLYGDTKHNKGFIRFHRRGRIKAEPDRDRARVRVGDVHLALGDLRRLMRIGRAAEATAVAHPPLLAVGLIRLVAFALCGKLGLQALER
jgi:Transposase DDE domain